MNDASPSLLRIFRKQRQIFLRVLARRLGDMDEAEETLQEAFLHFERAAREGKIANPDAYLMQIALNLAVDRLRQDASRRRREQNWFEAFAPERAGSDYIAATAEPDRALIAKEEFMRVQRYLSELSPTVRTAFVHHKIRGLSHSETAAEMGLSRSTVEKHIMKAMAHLMNRMSESGK